MAYKLLIADSSPSALRAAQLAFTESHFEVFSFEDGAEVLNSVDRIRPDLALIGFSLETRDGYEIGRLLRSNENFRDIPLLFLKGAFETVEAEKLAGLEHDGVIQKPFDSEKLVRTVKEMLSRKKGPVTIPEEPVLEAFSPAEPFAGPESLPEEKSGADSPLLPPEIEAVMEGKIKESVKREVLEVERELEKRIRARVLVELREWVRPELKSSKTID